ncbi:hypothetical protein N8I77_001990 [Diaporthe amygdali]|uniref:Uncharacterized protein n=1 Tax=Phomopsis amygdali TaxID=1214568 RepID=A0AAD9SS09_PHOAM|nr:hypothetical protein N8I77_001990 [Diaporthe amygdali]
MGSALPFLADATSVARPELTQVETPKQAAVLEASQAAVSTFVSWLAVASIPTRPQGPDARSAAVLSRSTRLLFDASNAGDTIILRVFVHFRRILHEAQSRTPSFPPNRSTATMFGFPSNPFLPTAEDSPPVTRSRCTAPGCQEFVPNGYPACPFHMRPVSPNVSKSIEKQHWPSLSQLVGRLPEPNLHNRKQLDAKVTARKSIASKPAFLLTASKTNGVRTNGSSQSAASRVTVNGSHISPKSSLLRQIRPEPPESPETPSRKRQRISSPGNDESSPRVSQRNFDLPSRDRSPSYGNLPARNFGSPLPNGSTGFLYSDRDKGKIAGHAPRFDANQNQNQPNGIGFNFEPTINPLRNGSSNDTRKASFGGSHAEPTILSHTDWRSPSARNSIAPERQGRGPAPIKAKKSQKISKSAYGGLKSVIRTPPLEKQRQRLTEVHDISALDRFIYGQEGSSQPPPGVAAPVEQEPRKREYVFYGHIDPRTHWTRPHSDAWYERKDEEIKARGGRKANLGKAAQRMKEQRLKESPDEWEESLPERVRNDEAWLSAMRYHHSRNYGARPNETPQASEQPSPVRKKRPYRRRNQGTAQVVPEPSNAAARTNSEIPNVGPGMQPMAGLNGNHRLLKRHTEPSI